MVHRDPKLAYGEEYPAAIIHDGIRLPLKNETRFSRHYFSAEHRLAVGINRFIDGSASITAVELQREWPIWTKDLQIDFCQQCLYLFDQPDFPDMLHFIMQHGEPEHWAAAALQIACHLPQQEAFDFLVQALGKSEIPRGSNIIQAITQTKHPSAEAVLRKHLTATWTHPGLWDDSKFLNWVAAVATNCIKYLVELGAPAADFVEQARRLSQHICSRNRDKCRRVLSPFYPEINFTD